MNKAFNQANSHSCDRLLNSRRVKAIYSLKPSKGTQKKQKSMPISQRFANTCGTGHRNWPSGTNVLGNTVTAALDGVTVA